jgi:hypothetical protein
MMDFLSGWFSRSRELVGLLLGPLLLERRPQPSLDPPPAGILDPGEDGTDEVASCED